MQVVITPMSTFLYDTPTPRARRVDEALCGMHARVLSEQPGGWALVKMEYGYEGYVRTSQFTEASPLKGSAQRIVRTAVADALAAPDVKAAIVRTVSLGCTVRVQQNGTETPEDGYTPVMFPDGSEGYMRTQHLQTPAARVCISALSREGADALRQRIVETAFLYNRTQYRWGGKSPLGIDCSGLCFMAYWLNGVTIYRDARIEPGFPIRETETSAISAGDLLYFPGHVGLYLGNGMMLHSSEAGGGVQVVSLRPGRAAYDAALANRLLTAGSILPR